MRELRLVFGFSTGASAAVVAIFLGGLGVGGWFLGRRADEVERPLAFYGWLEVGVAVSAAVSPLLLWLIRVAYVGLGGSAGLGVVGGTLVRLFLSALVLGVPTVLMGGTLPAATRAVETEQDRGRRLLALLYGCNTLGAVAGTFLSTFYLLEVLGTRQTLWASCVINGLVGLAAVRWSGRGEFAAASLDRLPGEASEAVAGPGPGLGEGGKRRKKKGRRRESSGEIVAQSQARGPGAAAGVFVLGAAAVTGFAFGLMELVWYRMLAPLLGGSTYTFGLILAVALLGIGLGSLARTWREGPATLSGFAATCALEAALLALPYALGDRVAIVALLLRSIGALGFGGYVFGWGVVAGLVVFPAAFVAGLQFPILISLLGQGRERVGTHVGLAYAWNTAGAILGSLAGGFGLIPVLSAPGAWVFATLLLTGLAMAALFVSIRRERASGGRWIALAAAVASIALLGATGPTAAWRHSPIGAGRVELGKASPNILREWLRERRRGLAWEADGTESSVAVLRTSGGYAFAIGGKIDGSSRKDAGTQVMGGLIGAALHPAPRRALVIGLGTGSTAGWLAAVPSIERVDVVELERSILHVADLCAPVNQNVLSNPKVRLIIGDAREYLLTSKDRYDIVFSEPSNPYRAGISSLFTDEFYRAVRDRLAPGGILLQWLQAYEVDGATIRTVYATLRAVFPEIETWYARQTDLILVATAEPLRYDAGSLRARLAGEPFASAMRDAWRVAGLEGFLSHFVARSSLSRALSEEGAPPRNSDDRNVIEFAFARSLGQDSFSGLDEIRDAARRRREQNPAIAGETDWTLVNRWRVSAETAEDVSPRVRPDLSIEELRQTLAQRSFLEERPEAVLANWRAQPWEPSGPVEQVVLGEALAQGGDERALTPIALLERTQPVEAGVMLARLRWRQGRGAESADALERAFGLYRTDPWPMPAVVKHAFPIAIDLAARDSRLAGRLYEALGTPFCLALLEDERLLTRLEIAASLDLARYAEALRALEPHVPWRREILQRRLRAYEATRDPRAATARRELTFFLEHDPGGSAALLASPAEGSSVSER